jgi:phosphatidylglycerophosphate synthase
MNLPNLLTILRIFFVPLLVAALVQEDLRIQFFGLPGTRSTWRWRPFWPRR